jgi:hypothetical protein
MRFKPIHYLILSVWFSSFQVFAEEQKGPEYENETNYDKSVDFFSSIFGFFQDTRKGTYNLMFETRDGIDGFVYDVKEDYINKSKVDISE